MKTHLPKIDLDQRKWHVVDANGAVLGRLAAQVADILRGKNKPVFTPHLDAGDFVVVINAEKVRVTGNKETDKVFMSYSGWKGGEKFRTVADVRASHPEKLITHHFALTNFPEALSTASGSWTTTIFAVSAGMAAGSASRRSQRLSFPLTTMCV